MMSDQRFYQLGAGTSHKREQPTHLLNDAPPPMCPSRGGGLYNVGKEVRGGTGAGGGLRVMPSFSH